MATKLWTLHFMRICLANLLLFISLYLLYPVLPVVMASRLGVPVSQTGGIYILFTLAMFFGSAFSTFVYCWLGSNLVHGDWLGSAVLVVLMLSIAFLLWKYQKQVLHLVGQFVEKRKHRNGTKTADLSESRRV